MTITDHEEQKIELEELFKNYTEYDKNPLNWGSLFNNLDLYFNFIANTKPLNKITQDLFLERSKSISISYVYDLYQKIVFDKQQSIELSQDVRSKKHNIRIFHHALIRKLNEEKVKNKRLIVIHTEESNNKVYFEDKRVACYAFKGATPDRFKIISLLFKTTKPKTIKDILNLLKKDDKDTENQNNLRKEIARINKTFKEKCNSEEDIIISPNTKNGRSTFLLNREGFEYKND